MTIRRHIYRWGWLCPVVMLGTAAGMLLLVGLTVWTALLVTCLLVCPARLVWGAIQVKRRPRPQPEQKVRRWRHERSACIRAPVDAVFAYVDDPTRLSFHMRQSSWQMGGGRMVMQLDAGRGQTVGSHIRLSGRVLGIALAVEEMVTERHPPHRKVWETTGAPKLVVIGQYRMGFEVTPEGLGSRLRVFIDYTMPERAPARWLGYLLGSYYARWCTQRMVEDAVQYFASLA